MLLALTICAFVFSLVGFGLGLFSIIEVLAQKRSTHAIQYVPATDFLPKVQSISSKSIEQEQSEIDKAIKEHSKKFNEFIPLSDAEDFLDV